MVKQSFTVALGAIELHVTVHDARPDHRGAELGRWVAGCSVSSGSHAVAVVLGTYDGAVFDFPDLTPAALRAINAAERLHPGEAWVHKVTGVIRYVVAIEEGLVRLGASTSPGPSDTRWSLDGLRTLWVRYARADVSGGAK